MFMTCVILGVVCLLYELTVITFLRNTSATHCLINKHDTIILSLPELLLITRA